jgi:hypothetical protein
MYFILQCDIIEVMMNKLKQTRLLGEESGFKVEHKKKTEQ